MWNQESAIPAYAVTWIAYHHSYESLRRTITTDVTTTARSRAVPTVAVIMPGYGDVAVEVSAPEKLPLPPVLAAPGWGSVSQFQYSRKNEFRSCPA